MRGYKSFTGKPHPGDLRHKVKIGYTENVINENGYPIGKDVIVAEVWAAVDDAGNEDYRAADAKNTEAVLNIIVRYRDDFKPGMWVDFRKQRWRITTLGGFQYTDAYLGLKARRQDGVSG